MATLVQLYALSGQHSVVAGRAIEYAIIGIYLNPEVNEDSYKSWIADECMYAIVYKAASIVFGTVLGDSARRNENDVQSGRFV